MGSLQKSSFLRKIDDRSLGFQLNPQSEISRLYGIFATVGQWKGPKDCNDHGKSPYGGTFGLAYSPAGDVVVAACEGNALLFFDPYSHEKVNVVSGAHSDCVNCIRFLDSRIFLSCSDDTTVGVWDLRNTCRKVNSLVGHRNWVKSIEYCSKTRLIVTTGFDDCIRLWDLNAYSAGSVEGKVVMRVRFVARLVLAPDSSRMVISSTIGMLIVIQNLDLRALESDFDGYAVEDWWFSYIHRNYSYLDEVPFTRERNRLEFCIDMLPDTEAWAISSIQMHPNSRYLLSRFTTPDGNHEWSTLHDVGGSCVPEKKPKLCYSIEECNRVKEYIKEACFSSDGRIVFSPFAFGIRLLAYDDDCNELSVAAEKFTKPSNFSEIKTLISHRDVVVSTRCSPVHMLLASGCLKGHVCFHQPRI
eukprot:m.38182 g.38182  ORF g.38182 m.38182 type:complete len:415 (+) comp32529_c0_seq11:50-1294(+)